MELRDEQVGTDEASPVELMGTAEVSKYLGVSMNTLQKWRTRNQGPKYYKYGGANRSAVRYDKEDVEAFRLAHGIRTTKGE